MIFNHFWWLQWFFCTRVINQRYFLFAKISPSLSIDEFSIFVLSKLFTARKIFFLLAALFRLLPFKHFPSAFYQDFKKIFTWKKINHLSFVWFSGHAFILVYSVCSKQSLEELRPIWALIKQLKGQEIAQIPVMLVGNKCDESTTLREVPELDGKAEATSWSVSFMETSAKNNINVTELFQVHHTWLCAALSIQTATFSLVSHHFN